MLTVNSLSGGKTSSYMAVHFPADVEIFSLVCIDDLNCKPKDRGLVQRVNDKLQKHSPNKDEFIATAEDDKTMVVMLELEQMLGREIVWVRGKSFEKVIDSKGMLPNMGMRYCTTELKIMPIAEYVYRNLAYPLFMNQGIRYDEMERMKTGFEGRKYTHKFINGKSSGGRNTWEHDVWWAVANYPLIYNKVNHPRVRSFWENKGIQFPEDSNCVGCFWKDVQQLRKNWDVQTNKMQWFSNQEERRNHFFKPNIDYKQIKNLGLQMEFNFGTGASCQAGFCTD